MSLQDPQAFCAEDIDQLMAAAQAGDRSQIGRLLNIYRGYLLAIASDRLAKNVTVKIAPSDVVQETLLRAVQAFPKFHGSTEFELRAWLQQILMNIVVSAHRHYRGVAKRDISREIPLHDSSSLGGEWQVAATRQDTPSAQLETVERLQRLFEALQSLDEKHRQIIQLRTIEQLNFEEVGQRLHQTSDAARKSWSRAIRQLAKKLRRDDSGFARLD